MFGMQVPAFMLKQFYQVGSLTCEENGVRFALTNPLMPATIVEILEVSLSGLPHSLEGIAFEQDGLRREALSVSAEAPVEFKKGAVVMVTVDGVSLESGMHAVVVKVRTEEFGPIKVEVEDRIAVL
jgi:hypothetical protein